MCRNVRYFVGIPMRPDRKGDLSIRAPARTPVKWAKNAPTPACSLARVRGTCRENRSATVVTGTAVVARVSLGAGVGFDGGAARLLTCKHGRRPRLLDTLSAAFRAKYGNAR